MQQQRKTVAAPTTTETRAASLSCHDAQKLDNGVAGMEDLSGSKDLSISLLISEVMVCHLLQTKHKCRQKNHRHSLWITSKLCLHSNLQTLYKVGTWAVCSSCVSSTAAHKRRPRNRPCPLGCAQVLWSRTHRKSVAHD